MSDPARARRHVVTGAAGFLGSWLCARLLADGDRVLGVDSLVTGRLDNLAGVADDPRFDLVDADLADGRPLEVPGPVDVVWHLASPASPRHYLALPVETLRTGSIGTLAVLELAQRTGARFLLASTSEVYGDPEVHPQPEEYWGRVNPIGPRAVYDEAKRFGEAATASYRRERGVDTVIARIFNTYGPRMALDDGRVVPSLLRQALTGQPLTVFGDGSQTRSLCYVEDTVEGLVRLAASGGTGPVNLGSEDEVTVEQLAETVLALVGGPSVIEHHPLPTDDPTRRRPRLDRARTELGWEPRIPLDEGLRRTLAWAREELALTASAAG